MKRMFWKWVLLMVLYMTAWTGIGLCIPANPGDTWKDFYVTCIQDAQGHWWGRDNISYQYYGPFYVAYVSEPLFKGGLGCSISFWGSWYRLY